MFDHFIHNKMEPWVGWIAKDPEMCKKVVQAFALLDPKNTGHVTVRDLEAREKKPSYIRHKKTILDFYKQAHEHRFGSDEHREWLRDELPKMSVDELANVIASLPEQAKHAVRPVAIDFVPDMIGRTVTKELNKQLKRIGAATMEDDLLLKLIGLMGKDVKQAGAKHSTGGRTH
jgi:hypothetical protein